jgi:putative DNA primase/helicase
VPRAPGWLPVSPGQLLGEVPEPVRRAALAIHGIQEEEQDYGLLLLADLRTLFEARHGAYVFTDDILQSLNKMEERPWPEYSKADKPMTARGLARLVGRFRVRPKTVRVGAETGKGYDLNDLEPVFRTYLCIPPDLSVTSVTMGSTHASAGGVTDVTDTLEVPGGDGRAVQEDEERLEREAIIGEGAA